MCVCSPIFFFFMVEMLILHMFYTLSCNSLDRHNHFDRSFLIVEGSTGRLKSELSSMFLFAWHIISFFNLQICYFGFTLRQRKQRWLGFQRHFLQRLENLLLFFQEKNAFKDRLIPGNTLLPTKAVIFATQRPH